MEEQNIKSPDKPNLAAFEENLFGELLGFHKKVIGLLRSSGLDLDKQELAGKRIQQLLANSTAEMKRTKNLNVAAILESAYEEVKKIVDEFSE